MRIRFAPLLLLCATTAASTQSKITVERPHDMAPVPYRACVSGVAHDTQNLIAVLHPLEWTDYYVQPSISVGSDSRFEALLYLAESAPHIYEGKIFELRLYDDVQHKYREGMRLAAWPSDAAAVSPLIRVVRKDDADSGCSVAGSGAASGNATGIDANPNLFADSMGHPGTASAAGSSSRLRILKMTLFFLCGISLMAFVLLVRLYRRAEQAAKTLSGWIDVFRRWLVSVALSFLGSVCFLWGWLIGRSRRPVAAVWNARGYNENLRRWGLSALCFGPMLIVTLILFYAEARLNHIGLGLIFSTESMGSSAVMEGTLAGDLLGTAASPETGENPSTTGGSVVARIFERAVASFVALWEDRLGFIAVGLAAAQGAFGVVLLWGLGAGEVSRMRPLTLVSERPLLSICFLVLNIALALLAANRGYELSRAGSNWLTPAVISGLLSLALPWILAFTAHNAIECTADVYCILEAAGLLTCMGLPMATILASWVSISLVTVAAVAAGFVIFAVFSSLAWIYFQCACLWGEFIERSQSMPLGLRPASVQAISILLSSGILTGSGYLIFRGLML